MDKELTKHLEYILCSKILKISAVSGGDISRAFLLESETEKFFCKVNSNKGAYDMFLAERNGLHALKKTKAIGVPSAFHIESYQEGAFLLMEYIEIKNPDSKNMELLGRRLAQLHQKPTNSFFGYGVDNYIGSLYQSNKQQSEWTTFYVQERIIPQFKLAFDKGLLSRNETPMENKLLKVCETFFPSVRPSLLHGDLWSGNFLIAKNGSPYLIDPAVYYGHYEVDLAMTKLFGGFGETFYRAYKEITPPEYGEKERLEIYQLYYLLVHLNLFGPSYKTPVKRILTTYF